MQYELQQVLSKMQQCARIVLLVLCVVTVALEAIGQSWLLCLFGRRAKQACLQCFTACSVRCTTHMLHDKGHVQVVPCTR